MATRPSLSATSIRVALSISALIGTPVLSAQPKSYWHVESGIAYAAVEFPNAKTSGTTGTLTVEHLLVAGSCRVTIGLALMKGTKFGTPLSNGRASSKMTVSVVGSKEWSERPIIVKYSNGFEAGIPAPKDLLAAMRVGKIIRIQTISDTPTFEFSLVGAAEAMQQAAAVCRR